MNFRQKLNLIMEDEKNYHERKRTEMMELRTIFNSPHFAGDSFRDPFQFGTVSQGGKNVPIYELEVPDSKAAVVTKVGTEWAPNIDITLRIDNDLKQLQQRDVGNPDDPMETNWLVNEHMKWLVSNDKSEDFDIGILADGFFIPVEFYERLSEIYDKGEELSA